MKRYKDDTLRRVRMLERILLNEHADEVKRLLALVGLRQFALRRNSYIV